MSANGLASLHSTSGARRIVQACTAPLCMHPFQIIALMLLAQHAGAAPFQICGAEIHTAILVICLCPFLLYCGLLALSTSGLPTKALWLAPHLTPRAAMVSEHTIPETMMKFCRTLPRNVCSCCGELQSSSAGPHLPSSIAGRQNRQPSVCVHAYDGVLAPPRTPSAIILARRCPTEMP